MAEQSKRSYLGIDIIRFFSALFVAVYHLAFWWWLPDQQGGQAPAFAVALTAHDEPFRWGWLGVPVFFVISGFVIAFTAEGRTLGAFVRSRALRLYPAVWICATLTFALSVPHDGEAITGYVHSMILLPWRPWISPVYWSLAVELAFYALVALAIGARLRLEVLGLILSFISSAYWILRFADFANGGNFKATFQLAESRYALFALLLTGCHFGLGVMLWAIKRHGLRRVYVAALLLDLIAGMLAVLYTSRIFAGGGPVQPQWHLILPSLIWLGAVLAIAVSIVCAASLRERLGHWAPHIRTLGLATYPLYLIHAELGRDIMLASSSIGPIPALLIALTLVIAISLIVVRLERFPRAALRWLLDPGARHRPAP